LSAGDHILCVDDVYGGTGRIFRRLAIEKYGMTVDFVDMTDVSNVRKNIKKNTKVSSFDISSSGSRPQPTLP